MKTIAMIALAAVTGFASADVIFDADFSGSGGFTHTSSSPVPPGPNSIAVNNFSLFYPVTPATDTTANFFRVANGVLESEDFGGLHGLSSGLLDVSNFDEVTFSLSGQTVGSDVFNNQTGSTGGPEFFAGFYSLDGGNDVEVARTINDGNLSFSITIDVSSASTLEVGLLSSVNGTGDGWDVTSITVTGDPIPAPASAALVGLGGLVASRRRRA